MNMLDLPGAVADRLRLHQLEVCNINLLSMEPSYIGEFKQRLHDAKSRVVDLLVELDSARNSLPGQYQCVFSRSCNSRPCHRADEEVDGYCGSARVPQYHAQPGGALLATRPDAMHRGAKSPGRLRQAEGVSPSFWSLVESGWTSWWS